MLSNSNGVCRKNFGIVGRIWERKNLIAVAESQTFVVDIKRSNEFLKILECLAKLDVRMVGA